MIQLMLVLWLDITNTHTHTKKSHTKTNRLTLIHRTIYISTPPAVWSQQLCVLHWWTPNSMISRIYFAQRVYNAFVSPCWEMQRRVTEISQCTHYLESMSIRCRYYVDTSERKYWQIFHVISTYFLDVILMGEKSTLFWCTLFDAVSMGG